VHGYISASQPVRSARWAQAGSCHQSHNQSLDTNSIVKILVTGATGFLGPHLCSRLIEDGHQLTVLRRPSSNAKQLSVLKLDHVIGDVRDLEAVSRAVQQQDAVIHAAASTAYSSVEAELQTHVNVEGTKNIIRACKQNGTKLVHVSSVAAIGISPDPAKPANEEFVFNLEGSGMTYHITKHRAEEEVMKEVAKGFDAVVVNPALIWGLEHDSYRGSNTLKKPMSNWILPNGPGGQCIVHVADVVKGILQALERGRRGERYILGGDNVSFREMSETTCRQLGILRLHVPIPGMIAECGNRVKNGLHWLLHKQSLPVYDKQFCHQFYDSSKARNELGFIARSFQAIVDEWITYGAGAAVSANRFRAVRI
jgi:dihydroflavonol-4-reductase